MKKFLLIVLVFSILMSFSACSNAEIDNRVNLPVKGHFSVKGDIIVETDKISVTDDVIPNAEAFTYNDGEFYKLKRYEAEIIVPKKYTVYGEYYGNDVNLKIQYFINNSTVYAYSNIDRKEMGNFIDIISIPQNDDSVIIQGSEILPIYVNLKNGKITPVFDSKKQGFDMSASVSCLSEDGKYAALLGTRMDEMVPKSYIINLGNFEISEIPMTPYNKEFNKIKHIYPSVFVDGRLYVDYALTELDIDGGGKVGAFFYDIKKKKSEELAAPLNDYTSIDQFPYIKMKFEQETGTLKIKNLKDIIDYSFSVYPSNGLWGSPNKTGQYFIGSYFDMPIAGYEDNDQWLSDIEQKANLILRDCNIDKIRHSTIVNLAFAYSFCGKREKVLEIANLLPDTAYSKRELLSLSVPAKERAGYKSECILANSESILIDILCISKHHYLWGDPEIAIDVCNRALDIIKALGDEGYPLYFKASAYEDLSMAYAKLQNKEKMFNAMEKVIQIYEEIEAELKGSGHKYSSPLFDGLTFDRNTMSISAPASDYEKYYSFITMSKTLKPYAEEDKFKRILHYLEEKIK